MEALFNALAQYIDFLVLGAVAIPALCLPFGLVKPLTAARDLLRSLLSTRHKLIQIGVITGVVFAALYFSGYLLNALGHAFLHRAHFSVIDTAARFDPAKPDAAARVDPAKPNASVNKNSEFIERVVPLIGPFLSSPDPDEIKSYWGDAKRQFYWDVCDPQSLDDMVGGGALKELRLLRGTVGLAQVLSAVCLLALLGCLVARVGTGVQKLGLFLAKRNSLERLSGHFVTLGASLQKLRYVEKQGRWAAGTLVTTVFIYSLAVIPAYWDVEFEMHSTIWSALPMDPQSAKFDDVLPCHKLRLLAERPKTGDGADESAKVPAQRNPPPE